MDRFWDDDAIRAADGRIGKITRVGWDEDQADLEPHLEEDEVMVQWSLKELSVEKVSNDWSLVERTLMRGDIVVDSKNPTGQMGTVVDSYAFTDIAHAYGDQTRVYRCVPTSLLFPASEWRFELLVSRNGWIGSVSAFFWRLKIQLKDSDTILTVDTRTMKRLPLALSREESPVLKANPSEGTFLVGTTLAIAVESIVEAVEGDAAWEDAVAARSSVPAVFDSIINPSNASEYAYGTVIAMEISSLHVHWADHAVGCSAGNTRPLAHQRISDVTIVDPFYHNSTARYELTWATPDVRAYEGQELFVFPDGTRIDSETLEVVQPPTEPSFSLSQSIDLNITNDDGDKEAGDAEKTHEQILPAKTEPVAPLVGDVVAPVTYFSAGRGCRYAHHPEPNKCATMSGQFERRLAQRDVDRQMSFNAPHVQHSGVGYQLDELAYVKEMTRFVDVQWQDGTISKKLLSTDLLPYLHLGDTDFQPLDYVHSVPTTVDDDETVRRGVIQSVDHENRVATIWWIREDQIEPHVSIYMLDDADSTYHYRVGYFVRRTLHEHESKFDGTIGLVDNLDDRGRVYVIWTEGIAGWYYPSQVTAFDVSDYDLDSEDDPSGEDMLAIETNNDDDIRYVRKRVARPDHEDQNEWESESLAAEGDELPRLFLYGVDESQEEEEDGEEEYHSMDDTDDSDSSSGDSEEDGDDGDDNDSDDSKDDDDNDSLSDKMEASKYTGGDLELRRALEESMKTFKKEEQVRKLAAEHADSTVVAPAQTDDAANSTGASSSSAPGDAEATTQHQHPRSNFSFGDSIPKNHKYANNHPSSTSTLPKLAMKEWQLLQDATLDGAYVVAYEERVDLFRFIVLGAHGTPFFLSWFMFDLQLEDDYPAKPPHVFFHSLGPKLHPNLYEDGNVCLSLLGTWSGSGVEMWDGARSNILQVVLSIQGLILGVKEPYYLEAGYDKHRGTPEGAANSLVYNERSFLLSVQQMRKLIENPPPEFKELIHRSFREHMPLLLSLGNALSTDPEVLNGIDMTMFGLPKGPPSIGFRSAFKGIFPSVKRALESLQ